MEPRAQVYNADKCILLTHDHMLQYISSYLHLLTCRNAVKVNTFIPRNLVATRDTTHSHFRHGWNQQLKPADKTNMATNTTRKPTRRRFLAGKQRTGQAAD